MKKKSKINKKLKLTSVKVDVLQSRETPAVPKGGGKATVVTCIETDACITDDCDTQQPGCTGTFTIYGSAPGAGSLSGATTAC